MKRKAFLKHLRLHGCKKDHEGKKHTMFWNPENMGTSSVPRHTEIRWQLINKICKDLGIPSPKGR